jgi:hypothetical protein
MNGDRFLIFGASAQSVTRRAARCCMLRLRALAIAAALTPLVLSSTSHAALNHPARLASTLTTLPAARVAAQDGTPAPAALVVDQTWETTGDPASPLDGPFGMAFAPDGSLWVADSDHNRFQLFAADGTYLETWGGPGTGEGQFNFSAYDRSVKGTQGGTETSLSILTATSTWLIPATSGSRSSDHTGRFSDPGGAKVPLMVSFSSSSRWRLVPMAASMPPTKTATTCSASTLTASSSTPSEGLTRRRTT